MCVCYAAKISEMVKSNLYIHILKRCGKSIEFMRIGCQLKLLVIFVENREPASKRYTQMATNNDFLCAVASNRHGNRMRIYVFEKAG